MSEKDAKTEVGTMPGDTTSLFLPSNFPTAPTKPARSAKVPVLSNGKYINGVYEREKRQGIRRSNGARKLKKLSTRHYEIISRHLRGESGEQISILMNITGITVSRVLNDPLVKEFLGKIYLDRQAEIDALAGSAIDVVRDGLRGDHSLQGKLAAVDKYTKLKDSIGKQDENALTAEDILERMFSRLEITDSNVQFNIGTKDGR